MNFSNLVMLAVLALSGCAPSDEAEQLPAEKPMAIIGKQEASELLLDELNYYKDSPFDELANEVGFGEFYEIVAEGDDGSKERYSVSIEYQWVEESQNRLMLTATIYGPAPVEAGIVPELHSESIVLERY